MGGIVLRNLRGHSRALGFTSGAHALAVCAALSVVPSQAYAEEPRGPEPDPSIATTIGNDPARAGLAASGITYGLNYIGEVFDVTSGGLSRGGAVNGRIEAYVDVDLEKFAGWKGGTFHANGYYIYGDGPSTKRLGNIFAVSNIEALETLRLFEIWIQQGLLDDKLFVRVGQLAADSEFFISSGAGQFFNGTFGWPGIVAADIPQGGPAYPLATPGISVKYAPNETLTVRAAVYNGSPADPDADDPQRADRHGLEFRIEDPPLIMVEGEVNYSAWLPGVLKVGGWKHVGDFTDLRTGDVVHGSHGLYAVVDQQIWKGAGDAAVNAFGRVSASPDKQNLIDVYFDAGLVFSGLIASRPKDSFGAAFGYGRIGDRSRAADVDAALPVVRDHDGTLRRAWQVNVFPTSFVIAPDQRIALRAVGEVDWDDAQVESRIRALR